MLTLAACASRTSTAALDRRIVCVAFEPIMYDRLNDTAPTIAAVKENNKAWDAVCVPSVTK